MRSLEAPLRTVLSVIESYVLNECSSKLENYMYVFPFVSVVNDLKKNMK